MSENQRDTNGSMSITAVTDEARREQAFSTVFLPDEYHKLLFTPAIPKRRLLYPIGFKLDNKQLMGLAEAMKAINDDACYLSLIEELEEKDVPNHLFVPRQALSSYYSIHPFYRILENAIYSTNGYWGIWLNTDLHGLIGGPTTFVDAFFTVLNVDPEHLVDQFVADLVAHQRRHQLDLEWVRRLLSNLYDDETAEQIINRRFLK